MDNAPRLTGVELDRIHEKGDSAQVAVLEKVCTDDLLSAFGLEESPFVPYGRHVLELLLRVPARRLACQITTYDRIVGESGLAAGGSWALERMARQKTIEGLDSLP